MSKVFDIWLENEFLWRTLEEKDALIEQKEKELEKLRKKIQKLIEKGVYKNEK